jgi:prepilin-type N-terminal cleavage/methylation domain-containing protein/prepilin-type processing-associated H-X9-DG protein
MNIHKKAFTLVELLIVIAIMAILASILLPVFARAKAAARKSACLSNIKQQDLACLMYANDFDDGFPIESNNLLTNPVDVQSMPTRVQLNLVQAEILPYVKSTGIYSCPTVPGWSYPFNRSLSGQPADGSTFGMNSANMQAVPSQVVAVADPDMNYGNSLAGGNSGSSAMWVVIADGHDLDPKTGNLVDERILKKLAVPSLTTSQLISPAGPNSASGTDYRAIGEIVGTTLNYSVYKQSFSVDAGGVLSESNEPALVGMGAAQITPPFSDWNMMVQIEVQVIAGAKLNETHIAWNPDGSPHGATSNFGFLDGHAHALFMPSVAAQNMYEIGLPSDQSWS